MIEFVIIGGLAAIGAAVFLLKKKKKKPQPTKVAMIGDSIIKRTKAKGALKDDNWNAELEAHGRHTVVYNGGIGGATTADIHKQVRAAINSGAETIIVDGGINDILQDVPLDEIVANITKTDRVIIASGLRLFRIKPHKCEWAKDKESKRTALNKRVHGVAVNINPEHRVDEYHLNAAGKRHLVASLLAQGL